MNPVSHWIENAVKEVKLAERVRLLGRPELEKLLRHVETAFLNENKSLLWWERLQPPAVSKQVEDGFRQLPSLATKKDEKCFLIAGFGDAEIIAYECSANHASILIGECPHFEYALIDQQLTWIVIENHHNCLIATGVAASRLLGM